MAGAPAGRYGPGGVPPVDPDGGLKVSIIPTPPDGRARRACSAPRPRSSPKSGIWIEVIGSGIASGVFRGAFGARMIYRTVMGVVLSVGRWFDPAGSTAIDEVIKIETDLLLHGVRV